MNAIDTAITAAEGDAEIRLPSFAYAPFSPTPLLIGDPSKIPLREWLFKPHYIRGFLSLTAAAGGTGKTALLVAETLAMVTGKPLLGGSPDHPLRVWYFIGEDAREEQHRRFAAAAKHHGITDADIDGRLFVDSGRDIEMVIAEVKKGQSQADDRAVKNVIAALKEREIDVLIIDPFVDVHRVPENDNGAMDIVAKRLSYIADQAECAIMVVHHIRKANGNPAGVDDARGASSVVAAARSARTLNTMTAAEAEAVNIDPAERFRYFRSDHGKANLTPRGAEDATWYKIESEELGNGTVENPRGDTLGVVTSFAYNPPSKPKLTDDKVLRIQEVMKAGGPWRADQRALKEPWVGLAIADALGMDAGNSQVRKHLNALQTELLNNGQLSTVMKKDGSRQDRAYIEVGDAPVATTHALYGAD